jgi:16S rRNA (guanine527-N7)-methyltransferase
MEKFKTYTDLLLKYNKVHRLSGAKNSDEVLKNIEDSIYPIEFIDFLSIKKVVDIGTGAGFPGMILAIALPEVHFTLVEPLAKRTAFLHLVKSTYGLQNVDIITGRIEDVEAFEADLITSRAVTKTDFLIELSENFIGDNTQFLFYKGENVYDEINDGLDYEVIKREKRNYLWIKGFNR